MTELHNPEGPRPADRQAQAPHNGVNRPLSVSARLGLLQFHNSGKFRVLQFADIQDGPKVSSDTISLIAASLDAVRPDVVVFTGNQIAGYDTAYSQTFRKRSWSSSRWSGVRALGRLQSSVQHDEAVERTRELVRSSISRFVQPLVDRGVPWAVTYGNHDFQCGLDNAQMDALYREFPGCLNPESTVARPDRPRTQPGSGLPRQQIIPCEPGTFALPVMDVDRTRNVLGLVLLDSGDYAHSGGYGAPSGKAMDFLRQLPELIHAKSLVFQHIPLRQHYRLLKEVPSTAAHAIEGYRTFSGHYFVLDESATLPGSYLGEGISCPDAECGEFDVLKSTHGYFAVACGHDHRNGFVGMVDGIALAATPTCGFGSYGPAPSKRASRLVEFDIRHPHEPRTQLLEFGELVGKPSSRKAYTYALNNTAASPGEAVNLLRRPNVIQRIWKSLRSGR
ncbi:MAG: metallophosphoesterase family protein [Bifidobacterium sp.]|nr:metallophosphoesterase family protein [Bifidobacterium sp.]MCI1865454.1 metallophosphoesterase family protein [Bifidobacterium sp.]